MMHSDLFPAAEVRPESGLSEIAVQIKTAYYSGEKSVKDGMAKFREICLALLEVKALLGHGPFGRWMAKSRRRTLSAPSQPV
jgi:hypothetical protein